MNARLALPALLATFLLAGCFGYPEGTVRPGDSVDVLLSGVPGAPEGCYASGVARSGAGILGQLVGRSQGELVSLQLDSADKCHKVTARAADFGNYSRKVSYGRTNFEGALGAPTIGMEFPTPTRDMAIVTAFNASVVQAELVLPPADHYPQFGLDLVAVLQGDTIALRLVSNYTGAMFAGPLEGLLESKGPFVTVGSRGTDILFADLSQVLAVPANATFEARIVHARLGGTLAGPVTGTDGIGYGHRSSPQLLG